MSDAHIKIGDIIYKKIDGIWKFDANHPHGFMYKTDHPPHLLDHISALHEELVATRLELVETIEELGINIRAYNMDMSKLATENNMLRGELDAATHLRDRERAVIDAAMAWEDALMAAFVNEMDFGVSPIQRTAPQLNALSAAVRSLREVTP